MNGLKTTKVVVVDDDPKDGLAFIQALSAIGIGAAYFKGDEEDLIQGNLKGRFRSVRLLALDMFLREGITGGIRAELGPIINAIDNLLEEGHCPLVIVVWTARTDVAEEFHGLLHEIRPDLKPLLILPIDKKDVIDAGNEPFNIHKIRDEFINAVANSFPLDLLMEWEQRINDAGAETVQSLFETVGEPWKEELERLLVGLARAAGPKEPQNGSEAFRALLEGLNMIHSDHMEQASYSTGLAAPSAKKLAESNKVTLPGISIGSINRRLLLDTSQLHRILPGNIYLVDDEWNQLDEFPIREGVFTLSAVIEDLFGNLTPPELAILEENSVPVLIEINPGCDHAQNKAKLARLIAGVIIPEFFCDKKLAKKCDKKMETLAKKFNSTGLFVQWIGPFSAQGVIANPLGVNYYLVLNSRYVLGMAYNRLTNHTPACRIRTQVLIDVQARFASHAARPGYVSVH